MNERRASLLVRLLVVVLMLLVVALVFVATLKSLMLFAGAAFMFHRAARLRRGER